ncbi:MAG: 50S ribosomal protein L22 [Acidimicrobiales bacterium]
MTAAKTNERPGTRAQAKNVRMSATKARVVLDLVRGKSIDEASDVLAYTERRAAEVIGKCLASAAANAEHNDEIDPETLYVSACYADEGRTMYRWRPRARGRATRIRKRTCHITVIVSPMSPAMLAREQAKREAIPGSRAARRRGQESASRAERVARSQQSDADDVAGSAEDEEVVDQAGKPEAEAAAAAGTEDVAVPETDESELTESLEDEGIVDPNAEAAVRAAEATDDAEAADQTDDAEATAEIADDVADENTEEK